MTCHICASPTCLGECSTVVNKVIIDTPYESQSLVERLRNRARIRRNIPRAKDGGEDRISNDLEEAANKLEEQERIIKTLENRMQYLTEYGLVTNNLY